MDLKNPQSQKKSDNEKFLNRVCIQHEKKLITSSDTPHIMLWTLWSIKEATYKIAEKIALASGFTPTRYRCEQLTEGSWQCNFLDLSVNVHVTATEDFVHALGVNDMTMWNKVDYSISQLPIGISESKAVRDSAYQLLARRGMELCNIVRRCENGKFLPPQLFDNNGLLKGSDITLSHDGRFVASSIYLGVNDVNS